MDASQDDVLITKFPPLTGSASDESYFLESYSDMLDAHARTIGFRPAFEQPQVSGSVLGRRANAHC